MAGLPICSRLCAGIAVFDIPGAAPVAGDYIGDGKTDPALCQETTGNWYVMFSGMN